MGKGKKSNHDSLAAELEAYLSPDEDVDEAEILKGLPLEDIEKAELNKTLLLDNLPITEKVERLKSVLTEALKQCDEQSAGFNLHLPVDDAGSTLGFAFVAFEADEAARTCQKLMNGYKLGNYEIKVYPYSALDTYANLPEKMPPPAESKYTDSIDFESWLFDGREQFVLRQGLETIINWCDSIGMDGKADLVYSGERDKAQGKTWCRKQVMWSPNGRYLATFHNQGIVIWGGKDFQRAGNFPHPMVSHAEFSPCERFLVTFAEDIDDEENSEAVIVWNVRTQSKVKAFSDPRRDSKIGGGEWPFMKWSHDGAYFARAVENGISLFSSATMKLVDGKPIAIRGIASFEWSPLGNYVAYWCPEEGDVPAKVVIFDPTTKKELRSKNLFNVSAVKLIWQNNGDFLCAQVTRHTKTKKTSFTNFEFFRMRDNGCPNETLSMTETVSHLAFEPNPGFRFTIVHSELPDGGIKAKMNVSIYSLGAIKGGAKLELVQVLEGKACQEVHWSPIGGIMVLASLDRSVEASQLPQGSPQPFIGNGSFEFYDADSKLTTTQFDHYMCNGIRWDPSGRFVATLVTQPMFGEVAVRYTLENGYKLFNFLGQKLREENYQDFYQFIWRPRPKSLLTNEELEDIRKKLPTITKKFEKADAARNKLIVAALDAIRVEKLHEFRTLMQERHKTFLQYQQRRMAAGLVNPQAAQESQEIVERVEELVSEKIEVVH